MNTITTISLPEALKTYPCLGATKPAKSVSKNYRFISTQGILESCIETGWLINSVKTANGTATSQHQVTLIHEDSIAELGKDSEGMPRVELFNSHDRTKKFMMAIGYLRFVCSNGLITTFGPAEAIKTVHKFSNDRLAVLKTAMDGCLEAFPIINKRIDELKKREMDTAEAIALANFARDIRFIYRDSVPSKQADSNWLLETRRPEDEGMKLWNVFNRIQENIIRGKPGTGRAIQGYFDNIRVNQELWKGAEAALAFKGEMLIEYFDALIEEKRSKKK